MSFRWYQKLQLLSIDIVIGALVLLHFYSGIYQVAIDWPVYVLLGFSVWAIYTIDHIRDANKAQGALRARYSFHLQNQRLLTYLLITGGVGSSLLLLLIPTSIIYYGLILVAFCAFYALFHNLLAGMGIKELFVALVYTAGIFVAPVAVSGMFDPYHFASLFLVAFINLLMFSWFERREDESDGFKSAATQIGGETLGKLLLILLALGLAVAITGIANARAYSSYYLLALAVYCGLILRPLWTRQGQRYRILGDGIFLLPILYELW